MDIRYGGTSLDFWSAVFGTALFAFSVAMLASAMLVNTHFETTVRIQTDRNHKVIAAGAPRLTTAWTWIAFGHLREAFA